MHPTQSARARLRLRRAAFVPGAVALLLAGLATPAWAQSGIDAESERKDSAPSAEEETRAPAIGSVAEGLLRLQRRTELDRRWLREQEERLQEVERVFEAVSKRFETLDAELSALRRAREDASALPPDVSPEALPEKIEFLERARSDARDDLNLVLRYRDALVQHVDLLQRAIALEESLLGGPDADRDADAPLPPATAGGPAKTPEAPAEATPRHGRGVDVEVYDRRVASARRELENRREDFERLARASRHMDQAIGLSEEDQEVTQTLLGLAQELRDGAEARRRALLEWQDQRTAEGAPEAEIAALRRRIAREEERVAEAEAEAARLTTRIDMVGGALESLRERRIGLDDRLAAAEEAVDSAARRLAFLESPWAPHRLARRLISAGPRVAMALMVLVGLWFVARLLARHAARTFVSRGRIGTRAEREDRAETLHLAARSLLNTAFLVVGALVLLDQLGVDVTLLLGGAAIFGVALAFGAQNLVQDYYFGVMILLENQYRVGNVVQIGNISGVVEDITLRMTMLRDLEGVAHFIPHSQVKTVSNLTHQWSRALLDVGVAYGEDVDRVMEVLAELSKELRQDPEFGPMILEDAEILGVDQLGESAVVVRMYLKTVPVKQWAVKRELLRRIKNRFDELGIEIPFPHRTLYHRGLDAMPGLEVEDQRPGAPEAGSGDGGRDGSRPGNRPDALRAAPKTTRGG